MSSIDKNLFGKYFVTLIGHIFIFIAGLIIIPIIVKTSGTQLYGAYVVVISLLSFLSGIYSFGTGFTVKRYLPNIDIQSDRANIFYPQFFFNIFSSIIVGVIAYKFFPLIAKYFLDDGLNFSKWLIILYLLCHVLYSQTADIYRYTHRVGIFNIATTMYAYIFLFAVVLWNFFEKKPSIDSLIICQIIAHIFVFIMLLNLSIKTVGFKVAWYKKDKFINDIKYGSPLILVVLMDQIISASDRYVIAAYMDLDSVAYYSIAYSVASIPFIVPRVIGVVLPPIMSRLKDRGQGKKISTMVNSVISTYLIFMIPFIFALFILGEPLLSMYAGQKTATSASGLLPIISFSILFYGVANILIGVLFVELKTRMIFLINLATGVINLVANILIFYIIKDIFVAAWTSLGSYIFMLIIVYKFIDKNYQIKIFDINLLKVSFSSIMMFLALHLLSILNFDLNNLPGFFIAILIGGAVYFMFLYLTKIPQYREFLSLINDIKSGNL